MSELITNQQLADSYRYVKHNLTRTRNTLLKYHSVVISLPEKNFPEKNSLAKKILYAVNNLSEAEKYLYVQFNHLD